MLNRPSPFDWIQTYGWWRAVVQAFFAWSLHGLYMVFTWVPSIQMHGFSLPRRVFVGYRGLIGHVPLTSCRVQISDNRRLGHTVEYIVLHEMAESLVPCAAIRCLVLISSLDTSCFFGCEFGAGYEHPTNTSPQLSVAKGTTYLR